jgi:ADP-heptose:LPS heptosyltransferase
VNVLVFKINKLGDNVVFLPAVQAIRAFRPDWRLLLFTNSLAAPLYGPAPKNEQYVIRDRDPFSKLWQCPPELLALLQVVRNFAPDRCLFASDQANAAYLLGLLSGATMRVGRKREFHRVPGAINRSEPFDPSGPAALDDWKLLLRLVEDTDGPKPPELPPPPDLQHLRKNTLVALSGIVIHPGASMEFKRWSVENFVQLANRLSREFAVYWIKDAACDDFGLDPSIRVLSTPLLVDLVSAVSRARLFIGNNSGPFQIASALGIPSVVINGPSSRCWDPFWFPERIRMLRDESVPCLPCDAYYDECHNPKRMQCMKKWTVDVVESEVRCWLERWQSLALG